MLRPLVDENVPPFAGNSHDHSQKRHKSFSPTVSIQNLTKQLYIISHLKKTMCAYNLSTQIQHSCIFFNSQEAETTIQSSNLLPTLESVATSPRNLAHLGWWDIKRHQNLTKQLYIKSHLKKTMCAYNLSTQIQHSCIFSNSQEAETTIQSSNLWPTLQSVATSPRNLAHLVWWDLNAQKCIVY